MELMQMEAGELTKYIVGAVSLIALACIGHLFAYLRDRVKTNKRLLELEDHKEKCEEDRQLLYLKVPSDPGHWTPDVEKMQAAAAAEGKNIRVIDFARLMKYRTEIREAEKNNKKTEGGRGV